MTVSNIYYYLFLTHFFYNKRILSYIYIFIQKNNVLQASGIINLIKKLII